MHARIQCNVDTTIYIAPQPPLLGLLHKIVHCLMLEITDQVQFQLFLKAGREFGFPNSCRKTVPGTCTSNL